MTDETTEGTEIKTMWSESLLETLYVALRKDKEDAVVKDVIADLKSKDYEDDYLINKVKLKVGPNAAVRVRGLLIGKKPKKAKVAKENKPMSKADQARANAAAKKRAQQKSAIVNKIKGIFGGGD